MNLLSFNIADLFKGLFASMPKTIEVHASIPLQPAAKPQPKAYAHTYMSIALSEIGTKEGAGILNNPEVVQMFADCGHPEIRNDATPWCAAFVGSCLHRAGLPGSGSLAARSYEHYGQRLSQPAYGAIGVKKRLVNGKDVGSGHVFFIVAADNTFVYALGGNQSDQVCVEKIRHSEIIAYRLPNGIDVKSLPPLPPSYIAAAPAGSEA